MNQEKLIKLLVAPHISEKATRLADANKQFVFKVERNATKPEIKRSVELMFNVEVASVQLCNIKGKRKGFGRIRGKRPDSRKAYIRLKPGFDINFVGGATES
jgi:large subunit ribosomal protein L23